MELLDPVPGCPACDGTGRDPDGRPCDCTAPPGTFQGEWPDGQVEVLPGVWAPAFCDCGNRMPCRHCQ